MSESILTPPPPIFSGQFEEASYRDAVLPMYRGNPLIEALPPILSDADAARLLAHYPEHNEEQRNLPSELRLHLIRQAVEFFQPLGIHLDLEQRFSSMIRMGYRARNPVERGFWGNLNTRVESIRGDPDSRTSIQLPALGMTIIGISGVGKTTTVERVLHLYSQVLNHNSPYEGRAFHHIQLVWLKLDCPGDGSIKGLCLAFFVAVDSLLDTHYFENYARRGRASVDEMLVAMARVASIHSLGVLVIDEIQNLSEAKSGGASKMLNFFVQLLNTIRMPVVLIGTYKALPILSAEFRQARRGTGQGNLVWENMKEDEEWRMFLKSLWRYQYTRTPSSLTEELTNVLYYASQGITDFAVKAYMFAQSGRLEPRKKSLHRTLSDLSPTTAFDSRTQFWMP